MTTIYLDNNATTQAAEEVVEAMLPYFHDLYGNPSSMHTFGGQVAKEVEEAREQVAALLGRSPRRNHLHQLRHRKRQHRHLGGLQSYAQQTLIS